MAGLRVGCVSTRGPRIAKRLAVAALAALTGACSSLGEDTGLNLLAAAKPVPTTAAPLPGMGAKLDTDLAKATEYWAKEYTKNPQSAETALSYARNLKAMGRKTEAFTVLQSAAQIHNDDKQIAAEYGRLAFEFDQTSLAAQLLAHADDPMRPDWRVISARGAALAKLGKFKEAVAHMERANTLAPEQASVQNNLALAYAMNGDPTKAESLLRKAVALDANNAKTRQNLAIVLGLQGKYDEATQVGATAVAADVARENTSLVRQMVKLEPKTGAPFPAPPAVAAAPQAGPAAPVATPVTLSPPAVATDAAGTWEPAIVSAAGPEAAPVTPIALKPAAIETDAPGPWQPAVVSAAP
jgi:Flp pilus assembly protein TadD